jgi:hypothetical protein
MTRFAWYLGNWLAQLVFAFRVGYRDGSMLRPGARPQIFKSEYTSDRAGVK